MLMLPFNEAAVPVLIRIHDRTVIFLEHVFESGGRNSIVGVRSSPRFLEKIIIIKWWGGSPYRWMKASCTSVSSEM